MRRSCLALALLGCGAGASSTSIANTKAGPRASASLFQAWGVLHGGDVVARTPAGPFADLVAVCAAFHLEPTDRHDANIDDPSAGCHVAVDHDDLGGPVARIGRVQTWQGPGSIARLEHFALQTSAGWYVLPSIAETGGVYEGAHHRLRSSELAWQPPEQTKRTLIVPYNYDHETADGGVVEDGSVICLIDRGVPACTPRIPTHRFTSNADGADLELVLDCDLAFANGAIAVTPRPEPDPESSSVWTRSAAVACRALPYAGTHVVTF